MRDSRIRIREAATQLFYDKGYHATTMREIADAVGMKAGSLYNHYPGKQELLFEIARDTMLELLEGGHQVMEEIGTAEGRLRGLVERHVQYHAAKRLQAKVADDQLNALRGTELREVIGLRDQYEEMLKAVLAEGNHQMEWRIPDIPVISFAIATMCTGVGTWFREGGRFTPDQVASIYGDFILAAIGGVSSRTPSGARPGGLAAEEVKLIDGRLPVRRCQNSEVAAMPKEAPAKDVPSRLDRSATRPKEEM